MLIDSTPFEKLRARALVWRAILTVIATIISIIILTKFLPEWFKNKPSPLQETLTVLLLYVYFFLMRCNRSRHCLPSECCLIQICLTIDCVGCFPRGGRSDGIAYGQCLLSLSPLHPSIFCFSLYRFSYRDLSSRGCLIIPQL